MVQSPNKTRVILFEKRQHPRIWRCVLQGYSSNLVLVPSCLGMPLPPLPLLPAFGPFFLTSAGVPGEPNPRE